MGVDDALEVSDGLRDCEGDSLDVADSVGVTLSLGRLEGDRVRD